MQQGGPGRWVMMPRQDERFVGARSRGRVRARERRRRVFVVLAEALAFTALIGAFPPLRAMWILSAVLLALLGVYVLLLLRLRPARTTHAETDAAAVRGDGPRRIPSSLRTPTRLR